MATTTTQQSPQPSVFDILWRASRTLEDGTHATQAQVKDAEVKLWGPTHYQLKPLHHDSAEWRHFAHLLRSNYTQLFAINVATLQNLAAANVPTICAVFEFNYQSEGRAFLALIASELKSTGWTES